MDTPESFYMRFGAFELDEQDARLTREGRPVLLAPKAFAVLCALARRPGHLLTKNALLDTVWGHQHVSDSVLKTTISELRAALSDDPRRPSYIETVSRRGYRFVGAVPTGAVRNSHETASAPPARDNARSQGPPLIGRQPALERLHASWNNALAGRRQMCWVAGEAGVGKTTLIDNFVAEIRPALCVHGQCVEQHGAGEPYLPVLDALGVLCRSDAALPTLLRAVAPTWLIQFPWLSSEAERESLSRELAGVGQERMLREFGELLERYTQHRPLVLVTEDLHWSDHATVHLMDHIVRRRGPARVLWLASFRLAEVIAEEHPLKTLRHELRLHDLCEEVVLDPFSEQEVADYIGERFPEANVTESFVRALHARTDGLPLFVVNVTGELAARGVLRSEAGGAQTEAVASLQVPESLAGVIEKQIAQLSPEQRALLEAASVCGAEFRPGTVAEILEHDITRISAHCDELARRGQWLSGMDVERLPDGSLDARYAFRHALYRQVFYQRIGALARAQLHRRVAASLERGRAAGAAVSSAELALHFDLGHEPLVALRHYAQAAENALRHFAPREAMSLAEHGIGMLPRCLAGSLRDASELALSAMLGVSAAQLLGVSSLEAKQAFERARVLLDAIPQHPLRGLVLHALGLVFLVRGEYGEARALGERIHELSKLHGDRVLFLSACSVLGQVHTLQGRQREGRELLEQGAAVCDELGDETLQAAFVVDPGVTMYATLAIPLLHLGLVDQARMRLEAARARAQRLGQPMAQMVAAWFGGLFHVRLGDADGVAALADAMRAVVDGAALAQGKAAHEWFRGWAQARQGAPRAGYQLIRDAYEHSASLGMYSAGSEVLGYAAEALILAGDWVGAQAQLDEAMRLAHRLDERVYLPQLGVLQGRIALARGEFSGAREAMQAALLEARSQGAVWLELAVLVALCELDSPAPQDIEAMKEVSAGFTEGFDTPLAMRAYELLRAKRPAGRLNLRPQ